MILNINKISIIATAVVIALAMIVTLDNLRDFSHLRILYANVKGIGFFFIVNNYYEKKRVLYNTIKDSRFVIKVYVHPAIGYYGVIALY